MVFAQVQHRATRRGFLKTTLGVAAFAPIARYGHAAPANLATPEADDMNGFLSELDDLIAERMEELGIPGAAVGVIAGDREHVRGFGVTSIDHPLPVGPDTIFQVGSTTKTYTATAIMRLVDQGLLDLDAPIQTYLPEFRVANPDASRDLRLWHLLTHTGGWLDRPDSQTGRGDDALATLVDNIAEMPQIVPPGTHFSYNNSGLATAGRVIEVVTGQPFEAAVTELVIEPLGLERARFFPEEIMTGSFAVGHAQVNGELVVVEPWGMERAMNPAGGLSASVDDELRYARFHLGDGTLDGTRLLSANSMERMQTPLGPEATVPSIPTQLDALGVSWLLWTRGDERILSHPGGTLGQQSTFTLVPGRDFAITVLTNANTGVQFGNEVTDWAMDRLLGIPPEPMEPVPAEPEQVADYIGSYVRSDETDSIRVSESADGLLLEWIVPDQPTVATPLHLTSDDHAFIEYMGLTAPVDFLRDDTGDVAWIRFLGRLVPKSAWSYPPRNSVVVREPRHLSHIAR